MSQKPLRPSHATVVAYLALFVALGGSGYAALTLPRDSVGHEQIRNDEVATQDIRDGQVKNADLGANSVHAAQIRGGSIGASEIGLGSLTAAHFKPGELPVGPKGDTGPAGATGATGLPGATGATGATGEPPRLAYASEPSNVTISSNSYVAGSTPGPSVTVDVPDRGDGKGFIEVTAQVDADTDGVVGLFDVTGGGQTAAEGQEDQLCADIGFEDVLIRTVDAPHGSPLVTYSTPTVYDVVLGSCSSFGPPGPVLLEATAGTRTFQLLYADCGCNAGDTQFENRKLWIAPRPSS